MTRRYSYPVDMETDETGRVVACFADLPGAATDGADRKEALAEAADCLEEAIAGFLARRQPVPPPSPARGRPVVGPGAVIAAKAALHEAMAEAGLSNTALARTLGCQESEVRRLLNPRHPSKIGRLEEALAILGKCLHVSVSDVSRTAA